VSVVVEKKIHLHRGRRSRKQIRPGRSRKRKARDRVPRVAYLVALALKMERMLARGEVKTQTELARIMGVTPARVTQILRLLDLAPAIQEAIIDEPAAVATERALFAIAAETCWVRQIEAWRRL
jgi:ParB-like chromosome segregation protein Spo0J